MFTEAVYRGLVAGGRLVPEGAQNSIPPRKVEAEVLGHLADVYGVMYAVHVGCDDEPAEDAVQRQRNADVGVIKHRGQVQRGLADEHCQRASAQQNGGSHLDAHREDHTNGVETQAGRDVEVIVGVMYFVKTPEQRDDVEEPVLQINDQIHQQDCRHELQR